MGVEWLGGLPRGLGGVGRPSWRDGRQRETHQEGREGSGVVSRPSWKVGSGQEDFHRAGRGREAILDGQEGSKGPPSGQGGIGRPS